MPSRVLSQHQKDVRSQRQKQRRLKDPDMFLDRKLRTIYGISLAEYDRMYAEQGGCCAICGTSRPQRSKANDHTQARNRYRLFVDHDHRTGEVRRLLCYACNVGVGHIELNPELFGKRLEYLLPECQAEIQHLVKELHQRVNR